MVSDKTNGDIFVNIKKLMKKDPQRRFASAGELVQRLDRLLGEKIISQADQEIARFLQEAQLVKEDKTPPIEEIKLESSLQTVLGKIL